MPDVNEGEIKLGVGGLRYPNITSCLTVTVVAGGAMRGFHATLWPGGNQLNIQQLCDRLIALAPQGGKLVIAGMEEFWDTNLMHLNLILGGVAINSVAQLQQAFVLALAPAHVYLVNSEDHVPGMAEINVTQQLLSVGANGTGIVTWSTPI